LNISSCISCDIFVEEREENILRNGSYTIHHRKPVSRGGNNDNENMVKVPKSHHKAWHALFDNYGADQILQNLQEYWNFYSGGDHTYEAKQIGASTLKSMLDLYQNDLSMEEVVKIKKILLQHRRWMRRCKSWILLFGGKQLPEVISIINSKWLDPEYELRIVEEKIVLAVRGTFD
jgi:hypothetical protein